jgi:hypothetical protein
MVGAMHAQSRDPRSRYDGGFDRWDHGSRLGWSVLWRASEHKDFALGEHQSVWVWDEREHIWSSLPAEEQVVIRREHQLTLKHLRRALPVLRLFLDGPVGHEQEAARAALNRIGSAIAEIWQQGRVADQLRRGQGWIDHPAALYQAITRDCRHQFEPAVDMDFDPQVFAALVAQAEEDFRAGRRAHPPRLRPRDLASLQGPMKAAAQAATMSMEEPEPVPEPRHETRETEIPETFGPQGRLDVDRLRHDLSAELESTDGDNAARHTRRRRFLMVASGLLVASAGLFMVMGGLG